MDFSNKLFLTFDIEWVVDEVLEYTYSILESYDIKATFFVTHDTPFLNTLRRNDKIELGIHPNFNPHLNNTSTVDFKETIDDLLKIVPKAVSYRSHALTQSSIILQYVSSFLKYDLNSYIPKNAGFDLKPFLSPYNMIMVPHFFEDDLCFPEIASSNNGERGYLHPADSLKVFDFHPFLIYLNCESHQRYLNAKPNYKEFARLDEFKNKENYGTKDFLLRLIEQALREGFEFLNIRDIKMEGFSH